jgi:hypothetical protein
MAPAGYTLEVDEDGICLLRSPWDPALRRAIRAIPGRWWDEDEHAWTIRLTPDRAESVARLMRAFPQFEASGDAIDTIDVFRDRRNLRKPMIEGVTPDDEVGYCLSFCDDWVHPVLDEVRRFFRPRPHPEIGRLAVQVNDETRNPLLTLVERNGVGLHIRARQRLAPEPSPGVPTRRSAITGLPQRSSWRGWVSTTITDELPYFVFATRGGIRRRSSTTRVVCGRWARSRWFRWTAAASRTWRSCSRATGRCWPTRACICAWTICRRTGPTTRRRRRSSRSSTTRRPAPTSSS